MKGASIVAVFGLVAYLLSYGVPVPESLGVLNIIAAVGTMAGYPSSLYWQEHVKSRILSLVITLLVALATVVVFLFYVTYMESNPSGNTAVWIIGFTMFLMFFGFGLTAGNAGVLVGKFKSTESN